MKRMLSIISIFALLLTSCTGEQGPPGFNGLNGQNGVNFVGQTFERTIDFTSTNNYQVTLEIPSDVELFESDMVLVYHLKGEADGFDVWKALPETVYISAGEEFQYNFEHNYDLVTIFIESHPNFDFNLLLDNERINQTFRIVVLPIDFINSTDVDVTDYNAVMELMQ